MPEKFHFDGDISLQTTGTEESLEQSTTFVPSDNNAGGSMLPFSDTVKVHPEGVARRYRNWRRREESVGNQDWMHQSRSSYVR